MFFTYTSPRGRALIDRALYLPKTWTDDRDWCAEAGVGQDVEFATKPELARRMLERLMAKHGRAALPWFTTDEAYGDNPGLRNWLDEHDLHNVTAVSCDARFVTATGPRQADELAACAPQRGWQRLSAGQGSKGHRLYDWLLIDPGTDEQHLLLVRRSISKPDQLAYYVCRSSTPVPLAELVRVAGSRWSVEETSSHPKRHRPRPLPGPPLRRLAAAFLAITAHAEQSHDQKRGTTTGVKHLIPLSCNEIRRLWANLARPAHPRAHTAHTWRRCHQTHARTRHYQRQHIKHHKRRL
ncbi:MAG: transposase [Actinomycetota bacterium]|nr:transposase [Actinomycetota bacterium]